MVQYRIMGKEAEAVEAELSKFDPKNSEYYKENLKKYKAELNELTTYVKTRIKEIPEKSRCSCNSSRCI